MGIQIKFLLVLLLTFPFVFAGAAESEDYKFTVVEDSWSSGVVSDGTTTLLIKQGTGGVMVSGQGTNFVLFPPYSSNIIESGENPEESHTTGSGSSSDSGSSVSSEDGVASVTLNVSSKPGFPEVTCIYKIENNLNDSVRYHLGYWVSENTYSTFPDNGSIAVLLFSALDGETVTRKITVDTTGGYYCHGVIFDTSNNVLSSDYASVDAKFVFSLFDFLRNLDIYLVLFIMFLILFFIVLIVWALWYASRNKH